MKFFESYEEYCDFGNNYISKFIEENPDYDNETFIEYVIAYNKADRDSGELQDVSKEEILRLKKEFDNKKKK